MSSPKDTSAEAFRSGQDAVVAALESWSESAKNAWANAPGVSGQQVVDPQQVIDQVFDFAEKMLSVQREFAKSLAVTAASATESVRQQSETVVGAVRQQAEAAKAAVKDAAGKAK